MPRAGQIPHADQLTDTVKRCVDWSSDLLAKLLLDIATHRQSTSTSTRSLADKSFKPEMAENSNPIDEWKEIIHLPKFNSKATSKNARDVALPKEVREEIRDFITVIASLYHQNPVCSGTNVTSWAILIMINEMESPNLSTSVFPNYSSTTSNTPAMFRCKLHFNARKLAACFCLGNLTFVLSDILLTVRVQVCYQTPFENCRTRQCRS